MSEDTVRHDLEGDLIRVKQGASLSYFKRLPLRVAWHVYDPEDLLLLDALVKRVEQGHVQGTLTIHYLETVRPLGAAQIRSMLNPHGPLAAWRFLRLAGDLCACLNTCHQAGVPQLLAHPGRIGLLDKHFVLLPTLAGVLPPLSGWLLESQGGWLRYIAPEVLRTRATVRDLLLAGDIYALGQTIALLATSTSDQAPPADPFDAAESIVDGPDPAAAPAWPAGLETLRPLVQRMTALLPENRPPLADIMREILLLGQEAEPVKQISDAISGRRLADARNLLADAYASQEQPSFYTATVELHMLRATAALAESTPDYSGALAWLDKAQRCEPQNPFVALQTARAYRQFTAHPQHLLLAESAFAEAALRSGWRADVIDEWLAVLEQLEPQRLLEQTDLIPMEKRTAQVMIRRASALLGLGRPFEAWDAAADYFERFEFDQQVFAIAQRAADAIAPDDLFTWRHRRSDVDRLDALLAIVWARFGDLERAALYMARAIGSTA